MEFVNPKIILQTCLMYMLITPAIVVGVYLFERKSNKKGYLLGVYIGVGLGASIFILKAALFADYGNIGASLMYLQLSFSCIWLLSILYKTASLDPLLKQKYKNN